jgi:hypothetical protein
MIVVRIATQRKLDLSQQTHIDTEEANARIRMAGPGYYQMSQTLQALAASENRKMTHTWMKSFARKLIADQAKPALDRLASRNKSALIVWFWTNCPELLAAPLPIATPVIPPRPAFPPPLMQLNLGDQTGFMTDDGEDSDTYLEPD